jgi:PEP-CTERM motif-containing protein
MKTILPVPGIFLLSIGLLGFAATAVTQATPQLGGDCHYCHQGEQPDALEITGFDEVVDDLKVFDIAPGGSVDMVIDVNNPVQPTIYRTVLRGLDHLNGTEADTDYMPLLYTPDPEWQTKSPGGAQYLFWEGQFYGKGPAYIPETYNYHLEISTDVEPGLYDLTAYVGGGYPLRMPGQTPTGGWSFGETFQLRVVPEPTSAALLLAGAALFCLGSWRRKRAAAVVLAVAVCLLTADASYAYPSRGGDCAVCHSIPGPSPLTGNFAVEDALGTPTTSFTVEAGTATEILLQVTQLFDNNADPADPSYGRGYMIVDGLDLLNVEMGPPPAFEDIPYTSLKYAIDEELGWHSHRGDHRYAGPNGQYYAQSTTDPTASMLFPLMVDANVVPGTYALTAIFAGGRPSDPSFLNGWTIAKSFSLTVLPPSGPSPLVASSVPLATAVPEPGTLLLLASALPAVWLCGRRRRRLQV